MSAPTLTVKVYKCAPGARGTRGQRWRWRATAANNRIVATAGEAYTNERDCLDAVQLVFGSDVTVYREHPDVPRVVLREATGLDDDDEPDLGHIEG